MFTSTIFQEEDLKDVYVKWNMDRLFPNDRDASTAYVSTERLFDREVSCDIHEGRNDLPLFDSERVRPDTRGFHIPRSEQRTTLLVDRVESQEEDPVTKDGLFDR